MTRKEEYAELKSQQWDMREKVEDAERHGAQIRAKDFQNQLDAIDKNIAELGMETEVDTYAEAVQLAMSAHWVKPITVNSWEEAGWFLEKFVIVDETPDGLVHYHERRHD